jgi:undecaprenyl-diphosphatase
MDSVNTEKAKKKRWWNWFKLLSAEFVIIILLTLGAIVVFVYAVDMVFIRKTTSFDENVFEVVAELVTPLRTDTMKFITFLGKHSFLIPANLVLLAYFFIRKKRWFSIRIAALALSSLSLMFLLKLSFRRLRPDIPLLEKVSGFSFPSGHALISVVFYGLLIYIVWHEVTKKWLRNVIIVLLAILILLISFSRIYLRVHYASDVIAGVAVGFLWLLVSLWIIGKVENRFIARKAAALQKEKPVTAEPVEYT